MDPRILQILARAGGSFGNVDPFKERASRAFGLQRYMQMAPMMMGPPKQIDMAPMFIEPPRPMGDEKLSEEEQVRIKDKKPKPDKTKEQITEQINDEEVRKMRLLEILSSVR